MDYRSVFLQDVAGQDRTSVPYIEEAEKQKSLIFKESEAVAGLTLRERNDINSLS